MENKRILKGKPFSFQDRDYLLQPYRDEYQDIIFYKGRQVEMSEFSMNWIFRKLDMHPYTAALHAFPRDGQCNKFSKQRLEMAIKDSKYIEDWYEARESEQKMRKFLKKPNSSGLSAYNFYILGATWESRKDTVGDASRGTSLDFIVYDERQDHPNDVETVLGEGASHSEFKQTLTLGTPKLPGTQFDMQWETSDKHLWHVKCEKCGKSEPLTMDNILDSGDHEYFYGCRNCGSPIIRSQGVWIPTQALRRPQYRGYHINQLMVCWLSANEIMKKFLSPTYPKRRFYNEVLGLAYGGDDVPITLPMLYRCCENDYRLGMVDGNLYVGVDWGNTSYAWVQQKTAVGHRLIDIIICDETDPREHPKKMARMLKRYNPHIKRVVCDAGPDITRFYNLQDALKLEGVTREVWACYYSTPPAKTTTIWNEKESNVTVGRSEFIEMIIDEISDQYLVIPGEDKSMEKIDLLMEHFCNIAAVRNKTSSGMEFIIYENTGPDHLLHAKVYADVASSTEVGTSIGRSAGAFKPSRSISMVQEKPTDKLTAVRSETVSAKFPKFSRRR